LSTLQDAPALRDIDCYENANFGMAFGSDLRIGSIDTNFNKVGNSIVREIFKEKSVMTKSAIK
jgi:hypothetical protein